MKKDIIFLDIDDTILDFKACEKNAIIKTISKYNINPTDELIDRYSVINKGFWEKFERKEITKPELLKQRFAAFFIPLGVTEDPEIINYNYLTYLSNEVFFIKDAKEVCKKMKEKCKVYVLTNGVERVQKNRLEKSGLLEYFDDVFISETVGSQKPDYSFYEYVYNKIGTPDKERIIMLGDSLSSDIQGGINFGIDTCWYNPKHIENKKILNEKITYEIDNLLSFLDIIKL